MSAQPKLEHITNYNSLEESQVFNYLWKEYHTMEYDNLTKSEIDKELDKLIKPSFYLEIEVSSLGKNAGLTLTPFRLIFIEKGLKLEEYTFVKVHERVHMKELTKDERYTDYRTVTLMYECENNYIRRCGVALAIAIMQNKYPKAYDCRYQLIEYFKGYLN